MKIGFIGAGNMAGAMIKSVLTKNLYSPDEIIACDKSQEQLEKLSKLGVVVSNDNLKTLECEIIVLAVKPQIMNIVLKELKENFETSNNDTKDEKNIIFLSIAAGIKVKIIYDVLGECKIVRVMPNTPSLVGEMAGGYCVTSNVNIDDKKKVDDFLNACGIAFEMNEEKLDAVTGLSGSGPAFVARLISYFIEAGKKAGLTEKESIDLSVQTFLGTAKLISDENMSCEELITMVSSPNGTTVAGREILENSDVKDVIEKTVLRARDRAVELGKD